jgi:hypothetical protein
LREFEVTQDTRAAELTARGTPESLATASLLYGFKRDSQSIELINRAWALAPKRAEIAYLRWRACASSQCSEEANHVADLQSIDPGNGLTMLPALSAALQREDQREVTRIVATIGAASDLTFYWNPTIVMMVDALSDIAATDTARPRLDLSSRMVSSAGLLAALSIPPLQPLTQACRAPELDAPGRRAACAAMIARLRQADEVIIQSLGLSMQIRSLPEDSPERQNLEAQRLQLDYVMVASGKERVLHLNRDTAIRLEAMRRSASEYEVMRAILIAYHEPFERPSDWKNPYDRSQR